MVHEPDADVVHGGWPDRLDHSLHRISWRRWAHRQEVVDDFELQGVPEEVLNSKTYQTITLSLQVEERRASAPTDEPLISS